MSQCQARSLQPQLMLSLACIALSLVPGSDCTKNHQDDWRPGTTQKQVGFCHSQEGRILFKLWARPFMYTHARVHTYMCVCVLMQRDTKIEREREGGHMYATTFVLIESIWGLFHFDGK